MKKTISLLFALVLSLALSVSGFAYTVEVGADGGTVYTPEYIFDSAGLLDIDGFTALEDAAAASVQYGCGIYVFTVDDMAEYGYYDIEQFGEAVYDELALGMGSERSGVLLTLSMSERDYELLAYGAVGNAAFTDYGKELLEEKFLDNFREDDWYGGFADYVDGCVRYLEANAAGAPVDVEPEEPMALSDRLTIGLVAGVVLGMFVAVIACAVLKRQLKSVRRADGVQRYVVSDGADITLREDTFLRTTEVRTPKAEPKSGGGGGGSGGTRVNSRGFSHSSGKF